METHNTKVEEKYLIKFVIDIVWEATDGGVKMTPNQFSHFEEPLGALTDFQTYLHHQLQKAREEEMRRCADIFTDNVLDLRDENGKPVPREIKLNAVLQALTNSKLDQDNK